MTDVNGKSTASGGSLGQGLEGRDCVPFFSSDKSQIIFEFCYLVVMFVIACAGVLIIQLNWIEWEIRHADKLVIFAALGGFLGGWVYDAKWFYRVTARGKNNQHGYPWQPHKFYWRILTPFLSGIVALATFLLGTTDFCLSPLKTRIPLVPHLQFAFY
jgi:hypothetical protein